MDDPAVDGGQPFGWCRPTSSLNLIHSHVASAILAAAEESGYQVSRLIDGLKKQAVE